MRIFAFTFAILSALLLGGCADPVVFAEVFQQKEGQNIYTQYNIWYTDPADISCLNIQRGKIIPIGTRIIPIETRPDGRIVFKDESGTIYTIRFDEGYRLTSMTDYIAQTFTTTPPDELLAGVSPAALKRIKRGEVVPGMTRREVILAYGPPPPIRTPDLRNESWIYWLGDAKTIRLVFRGDRVANILNVDR